MTETGLILDAVLMLLLIGAVAFGIRLERKLAALRSGHAEFAKAVGELNVAAGRAENALNALKSAGQDTDLLHDRIVKAREVKAQLETLIERGGGRFEGAAAAAQARTPAIEPLRSATPVEQKPAAAPSADQSAERASLILQALAANQTAQQSLNRARRKLDEDLFAA